MSEETVIEKLKYDYKAEVVRVVDGDTIRFRVDVGFYMTFEENFRLLGINTPEIRGEERPEGLKAKEFVIETLSKIEFVRIETSKTGKYGRWLANVYYWNEDENCEVLLNDQLVKLGYAEVYNG